MFIVPYLLIIVVIQLFAIIYLLVDRQQELPTPSKQKKVKRETFHGFYIDD